MKKPINVSTYFNSLLNCAPNNTPAASSIKLLVEELANAFDELTEENVRLHTLLEEHGIKDE